MRKIYLFAGMWAALFSAKAQQTATFEEIVLQKDSYYNGSDLAGGFLSGEIWFPNSYIAEWGYWNGFSVSNMKDTITAGYGNQFSAITAEGADSSENYAVVYCPEKLTLQLSNPAKVEGFFITNSVYAYMSMAYGDTWTKKFGGAEGSDPDYFVLRISGIDATGDSTHTIEFYLADFRSDNPDEDYIVNNWQWLDLSPLGVVREINFHMESSDMGDWGLNTPAYFCIDNFIISDITSFSGSSQTGKPEVKVYPNPVENLFQVDIPAGSENLSVTDGVGRVLFHESVADVNTVTIPVLANMPPGIYYLTLKTKNGMISEKIMKY